MTRPKPKTVRAWGFAVTFTARKPIVQVVNDSRDGARKVRDWWNRQPSCRCGPVTRIEVPAPKERKR